VHRVIIIILVIVALFGIHFLGNKSIERGCHKQYERIRDNPDLINHPKIVAHLQLTGCEEDINKILK